MSENYQWAVAIGKRLKRLRLMAGFNRNELAKAAQVGVTSITYWENPKPNSSPMKPRNVNKVITAARQAGVECSENWLLKGLGQAPRLMAGLKTPEGYLLSAESPVVTDFSSRFVFDKEIHLFTSSHPSAAIVRVENACMSPAVENGDAVGGIWQPAADLKSEKICIVEVNSNLQVRRVKKGSREGMFDLSYLVYDSGVNEPFELKDYPLEKVAPVIRIWRN